MSWVIVERSSSKVIAELFDKRNADRVNRHKYEVVPIGQWLASVNRMARSQHQQQAAGVAAPEVS